MRNLKEVQPSIMPELHKDWAGEPSRLPTASSKIEFRGSHFAPASDLHWKPSCIEDAP